ncbi:MAG: hypothetical protein H6706_22245 [Myxococcales bacterium]|nr:hypothetical protein [Myxococcales bacterium]
MGGERRVVDPEAEAARALADLEADLAAPFPVDPARVERRAASLRVQAADAQVELTAAEAELARVQAEEARLLAAAPPDLHRPPAPPGLEDALYLPALGPDPIGPAIGALVGLTLTATCVAGAVIASGAGLRSVQGIAALVFGALTLAFGRQAWARVRGGRTTRDGLYLFPDRLVELAGGARTDVPRAEVTRVSLGGSHSASTNRVIHRVALERQRPDGTTAVHHVAPLREHATHLVGRLQRWRAHG